MNKKILIITGVILVVLILILIFTISITAHADIHPNNLFIAAKIMNGKCGNNICEIDEIITAYRDECFSSPPEDPVKDVYCARIMEQKILCEQDCKKAESTTKPETGQ